MLIDCQGYTLEVVPARGNGCRWAVKAAMDGKARYRGFHYKGEAQRDAYRWAGIGRLAFGREFVHNFHTLEEECIREMPDD